MGKFRMEGKEYTVADDDVRHFGSTSELKVAEIVRSTRLKMPLFNQEIGLAIRHMRDNGRSPMFRVFVRRAVNGHVIAWDGPTARSFSD